MSGEFLKIQDLSDQIREQYASEAKERARALKAQKAAEREVAEKTSCKKRSCGNGRIIK